MFGMGLQTSSRGWRRVVVRDAKQYSGSPYSRRDPCMNEQERVAYLRSMGCQVYYPRFILPGARPSPHYEQPDAAVAEVETAAAVERKARTAPASSVDGAATARELTRPAATRQQAAKLATEKPATEKPATEEAGTARKPAARTSAGTGAAAASPTQDAAEVLRFNLQYFPINESLAVINESPHQLAGRQGREVQDLLLAILRALSVSVPEHGLQAEQFNWPLAEGLEVMGDGRRGAGLALQGFISQRQEQDRFQNLLVFTAQLADLLGPGHDKRDEHYGDHGAVAAGYQLCISHSLSAMIAHPQLKREVWAHLQALHGRLQAPQ